MKKYNIIYADPPWSYKENWGNGAVWHHYGSMNLNTIKSLPVTQLADENCHLYLWVTCPMIQEGLDVCNAWGFKYKQLITWVKTCNGKPRMGLGYYFRVCTEHVIFGVKGKLPRINKRLLNVFEASYSRHSKKPDMFRDVIIRHSGNLPRVELFARQNVEGWDCIGNDIDGKDIRNSLKQLMEEKNGIC